MSRHQRNILYLFLLWSLTCQIFLPQAALSGDISSVNPLYANSTSPSVIVQTPDQNELSRQSAFWAVVAIALATMADAPGTIGGYPKELTFYLRISPITCLIHALATICLTAEFVTRPGSKLTTRQALSRAAKLQMGQDVSSSGSGQAETPRSPIRFILFIFGAVPQAIKLYACEGIPRTHLISTCYLSSFVINEIMFYFARWSGSNAGTNRLLDKFDMIIRAPRGARAFCLDHPHEFMLLLCSVYSYYAFGFNRFLSIMTLVWSVVMYVILLVGRLQDWRSRRRERSMHRPDRHKGQKKRLLPHSGSDTVGQNPNTSENFDARDADGLASWGERISVNVIASAIVSTMVSAVFTMGGILMQPRDWNAPETLHNSFGGVFVFDFISRLYWLRDVHLCQPRSCMSREIRCVSGLALYFFSPFVLWCVVYNDQNFILPKLRPEPDTAVAGILLLTSLLTTFVIAGWLATPKLTFRQQGNPSHGFPTTTYCCLTVLLAIAYFKWDYDSTGTYKPSWTDWLG